MKRLPFFLLLVGMVAFVSAVIHLFQLRFAGGDIYPPYSSLRSDPLGVKALFQSFDQLLTAQRNFQPLARLGEGRGKTLFYLGLNPVDLEFKPPELHELETFVTTGGRLVMTFYPEYQPARFPAPQAARFGRDTGSTNQPSARPAAPSPATKVSLQKRWGFAVGYAPVRRDDSNHYLATEARLGHDGGSDLPASVGWHSGVVLTNLDPAWRVLYARPKNSAVLVERDFDQGTVVIATDSYLLSNEALLQNPQPALLAWLLGNAHEAVFDETHFGVAETPGVATLLRKYRLHTFFASLLILAGLFVWKNSSSLVPVTWERESQRQHIVQGREASAGLVNLLRRNVPVSGLLGLCFEEWKKSSSHAQTVSRLGPMQAVLEKQNTRALIPERDRVELYRQLSEIVARKT